MEKLLGKTAGESEPVPDKGAASSSADPQISECDHEWQTVEYLHEVTDEPVSMNPFTDAITYRSYSYHASEKQKCTSCGATREIEPSDTTCDCEPSDGGCRCRGECYC